MISFWALPPWLTYAVGCNLPNVIIQRNVTFCVKLFEAASLSSAFTRLQIPGLYPVWHIMWDCVCWVSANIRTVSYNRCVSASWGTHCSSGMRSSDPRSECAGAASCREEGGQERRDCVFHIDKQPDSGGNTKAGCQRKSSGLTEAFSWALTVSQGGMTTEFCGGEKSPSCNSSSYSPTPSPATHTMWNDASWILEIHSSALKNTMQMNEINKESKGPFSSIYYLSLLL